MNNKTLNCFIFVGDIVHTFKDKIPHQCGSLGKVIRLLPGKDGITRAAGQDTYHCKGACRSEVANSKTISIGSLKH